MFYLLSKLESGTIAQLINGAPPSHGGTIQQMICWFDEEHGFERPEGHDGKFWVKIRMANTAVTRLSMVVKEDGTGFSNVKIFSVYNNDHLKGKEGLKDGYAY